MDKINREIDRLNLLIKIKSLEIEHMKEEKINLNNTILLWTSLKENGIFAEFEFDTLWVGDDSFRIKLISSKTMRFKILNQYTDTVEISVGIENTVKLIKKYLEG